MQFHLAESLQREVQDGFMTQQVVLDVVLPQFMVVAQHQDLPPFVVYKGKHLYTAWTKGGSAGAMYAASESGWVEKVNYESWFKKMFLPAVRHLTHSGLEVLFFDGHHSHISLNLIELSRDNNVHLMLLPSKLLMYYSPLT